MPSSSRWVVIVRADQGIRPYGLKNEIFEKIGKSKKVFWGVAGERSKLVNKSQKRSKKMLDLLKKPLYNEIRKKVK